MEMLGIFIFFKNIIFVLAHYCDKNYQRKLTVQERFILPHGLSLNSPGFADSALY